MEVDEVKTVAPFVCRQITQLDQDTAQARAALAKLRHALGKSPDQTPEIWYITISGIPEQWESRHGDLSREEWAIHTALTLYALHRQGKLVSMSVCGEEGGDSIGGAAARLIRPDRSNEEAIKKRFDTMATSADFAELSHHARSLVQLLKAGDISMDYPRFAQDLNFFQIPMKKNSIRLQWGEDYYRVLSHLEKEGNGEQS